MSFELIKFPAGELQVKVIVPNWLSGNPAAELYDYVDVYCKFSGSDDITSLSLIYDAIKRVQPKVDIHLNIPYFPAARQDRTEISGESYGLLVYANLINSIGFKTITVADPHSDVLAGMFNVGVLNVISQERAFDHSFHYNKLSLVEKRVVLISPDNGASKKTEKIAKVLASNNYDVTLIQAIKRRDYKTGKIESIIVPDFSSDLSKTVLVVDDICDGGGTFIALHAAFKHQLKPGDRTILWTTHGIYSKGKEALSMYDDVLCYNEMSS
jgi:ribose-phosphate pyrophosphokinase